MNKRILIPIVVVIIGLAAMSTFFEFSQSISGKFATPVGASTYAILTFLLLVGISLLIMFRKHQK
ncbi:MAG: hypothetical protein AABW61_00710 [Candidatus Aenigmatarchaeota archaeon]